MILLNQARVLLVVWRFKR